jgi:translation elongation factor EF-Tu-like GTPase
MSTSDDFIAELHYRATEENGRTIPVVSGYRPGIQFPFSSMQTSGRQNFVGTDIVYPGETVKAMIKIISIEYFAGKLEKGMSFEFKEGTKVIGTGIILEILNPELQAPSE